MHGAAGSYDLVVNRQRGRTIKREKRKTTTKVSHRKIPTGRQKQDGGATHHVRASTGALEHGVDDTNGYHHHTRKPTRRRVGDDPKRGRGHPEHSNGSRRGQRNSGPEDKHANRGKSKRNMGKQNGDQGRDHVQNLRPFRNSRKPALQ